MIPFALVFVLGLKFLTIFRDVRIHTVKNHRLGHFAINTELSRLDSIEKHTTTQRNPIDIYCFQTAKHSNSYLAKMWKRELFVLKSPFGQFTYDIAKRFLPTTVQRSTNIDKDGLLISHSPSLTLNDSELKVGRNFLDQLEEKSETGFVCLNVRDPRFLAETIPVGWKSNRDWSYHDFRNSDIQTYRVAAETLAERGYSVFRMGAIVRDSFDSKNPKVIDYATNAMRTEFLDIFLGAECTFTISVGSGWDALPTIFRRPILQVNALPIFELSTITLQLVVYPKTLVDANSGTSLSLIEILSRNAATLMTANSYKEAGVEIRDLSSEELVEAVTEMAQRVEGTFVETPEQKEMQAKLKRILSTHPKLQPSPNYYPIRAQFASCFLSRYPNFLDGLD